MKTLFLFFAYCCFVAVMCEDVVTMMEEDEAFHLILGKSVYIPDEDLLGSIPNGITFFKDIPKDCLRQIELDLTTKDQSFYKNTAEFYKSVATETNLKASYEGHFTLGVTLDVTTKHVSGNKRDVSGTSLNLATKKYELQMSPNCLYETALQPRALKDFSKLQTKINSPWLDNSWRDYKRFLKTHGSHIISGVTYGASIDQYAFAEKTSSYTAKDLTVKACASLGVDIKAGSIGLSACSGVSKEEKENISKEKMTSTITVRGGAPNTRHKLTLTRTDELILQFLDEGTTNPTPIAFELTPIWQIMSRQVNAGDQNEVQAANLRYFFDGYLNFGCPYRQGNGKDTLQKFDLAKHSTPQDPVYQCSLAPEGCHSNNDCHYNVGVWCRCQGPTCIRHGTTKSSTGQERTTAAPQTSGGWGWHGCDWVTWGSRCGCTKENTRRKVIF